MEKEMEHVRVPLFDGTNYPQWKYRVSVLLEEHELMPCVEQEAADDLRLVVNQEDKQEVKDAKAKLAEQRSKKERRCKSLLISRIADNMLEYIQDQQTPRAIWLALERVFERKSVASRLHLQKRILTLRHDGGRLQDHFLTFERLIREYKSTGARLEEIDIVCYLLLTLGPAYGTIVTALETMSEDKLTLEFCKCRLLDEETKRIGEGSSRQSGSRVEAAAFSGSGRSFGGLRKQQKKKKNTSWKCFGCRKEGHKIADCPEERKKHDMAKSSAHLGTTNRDLCFLSGEHQEMSKTSWIIDSGSCEHLTNNRELFEKLLPMKQPMRIAVAKEGQFIVAEECGDIRAFSLVHGKKIPIRLQDVLYIPDAQVNLLSVRKMEMAGLKVTFADGVVTVERDSSVVAIGTRRGKLYVIDFHREQASRSAFYSCGRVPKDLELWHRSYGHLSAKNLKVLIRNDMVNGLNAKLTSLGDDYVCEPCITGKQSRKPFSAREGPQSSRVLELVHSDVCGPVTPEGLEGERYFLTFVDDWSRFTMVCLLNLKDEVFDTFRKYEFVNAKFGTRISRFRCDNGGEYISRDFKRFCDHKGIQIEWTVPYTPEQNGVSERMNRTLVEKARSMLEDSGIGKRFWGPAIETAAYLTNRSPASALDQGKTPFEMWEGRKPNVKGLRAFGSAVFVHIPKERRKKLEAKSWKGIFVGYANCGYRVWNPNRKEIVVARDVVFLEEERMTPSKACQKPEASRNDVFPIRKVRYESDSELASDAEMETIDAFDLKGGKSDASGSDTDAETNDGADETFNSCTNSPGHEEDAEDAEDIDETVIVRKSERDRKQSGWLAEYDCGYTGYAMNATAFVDNLSGSLAEMKKRPDWNKWQAAVRDEMDSLERNKTWTLEKLPAGREPISCKWLFKMKENDGNGEKRYKARLVARGFSQKAGFDYGETYSPVARMDTVRVVLAVANEQRMIVHQMDVKTAFLNGRLEEQIFMTQPEGFEKGENLVCRLNRSLYGLKQASRAWNTRFHSFVLRLGFNRSLSDPCLYVKGSGSIQIILVLYVDDLLVVGRHLKEVQTVKRCFGKEFEMTDIGEVKSFLGMKIDRDIDKRTLRISQRRFLENLLCRFNMSDCKPASTPMECRLHLEKGDEAERTEKPYRELVGCLSYVALTTRPDLCAAVNHLSQFQSCPTELHWTHAKRVLRYIKGTLNLGLVFSAKDTDPVLEAYADADWANDPVDRRSITGCVFRVCGGVVSWLTRKQSTVSLSSTEAELVALSTAVCHGIWMVSLLKELTKEPECPVIYYEDNQSTIRVVEDERHSGRLKHVDVRHRFIREEIQRGRVAVHYIPTGEQVADVMTKGLPVGLFQKHRDTLGVTSSEY